MSKNITKITLSEEDKLYLQSLSKTRTIQAQVVDRARIILFKADGKTDKFISEGLGIGLSTVRRCIAKYIDGGAGCALFDDERSGGRLRSQTMQKLGLSALPARNHVILAMQRNYGPWPHCTGIYSSMQKKRVIRD